MTVMASDVHDSWFMLMFYLQDTTVIDDNQPIFNMVAKCEKAHEQDVNSIAWNPTENIIASASDDGTVKLWRVIEG